MSTYLVNCPVHGLVEAIGKNFCAECFEDTKGIRSWPDQCLHRELGVTGIPGVFVCLEAGCGEKIVLPELGVTHRLSVASEERDRNANSKMLLNALKGHI